VSSQGEGVPLGMGNLPASGDAAAFQEPPDVRRRRGAGALSVAARLLSGASVFFFLAFLFAYFYLRSLNQDHMWRPAHVKPDQGLGGAFIACLLVSVALTILAGQRMKRGSPSWTMPAIGGLLFGLGAVAVQCIEYTVQDFGPTNGAYASVFCAWTGFYLIAVLGAMYWLETQVATELRARRTPSGQASQTPTGYEDPDELLPRGLDAAVFFWAFLGAIGVVTYVTLYLL